MKLQFRRIAALTQAFIFASQCSVFAAGSAGFENASYTARSLAQGDAVVARAEDPSTMLFNPAGLVELPGIQTNLGVQNLHWAIFHRDRTTGDHTQNNFRIIPIPSFYLTANPGKLLHDRFAMGVGVNSPFGLASSFPANSVGKYSGYKNSLRTMATTIAGAFRVNENINIGGGAINYYVYDYSQKFNYPNSAILGIPGFPDGLAYTEMDGYGWGWNLGTQVKLQKKHKFGLAYRSKANVKTHGRVVIEDLVLGGAQGFDTFPHFESGAHSDIPLPADLAFGYAYEPSKKWAAEFDVNLTFWNVFKDQDFEFDRPNAVLRALGTIPRDYDQTWNFHLGGHYLVSENLDLLGGFFFYQAPSPKNHVDNFLPDANRFGWTVGTSYKVRDRLSIDFNYLFLLFASRDISNPQQTAKTGTSIDGQFVSILHGPFLSVNYTFDFPGAGSALPDKAEIKPSSRPVFKDYKTVTKEPAPRVEETETARIRRERAAKQVK